MTAPEAARHLLPATRQMLELKDAQRIQFLRVDRWIDYPRASEALARLQRLLETPRRERMPCMLLHGPSDIGKTLIIAKFVREHPPTFDERRGTELRPVITMQMPPTPDQRRFYRALLDVVGVPQGPQATLASLEQVARDILRRMVPQLLVVDEVHHLLAGSAREQRASLNLLKYLANELRMSVVAVGTNDAPVAFQSDAQIQVRTLSRPHKTCACRRNTAASRVSFARLTRRVSDVGIDLRANRRAGLSGRGFRLIFLHGLLYRDGRGGSNRIGLERRLTSLLRGFSRLLLKLADPRLRQANFLGDQLHLVCSALATAGMRHFGQSLLQSSNLFLQRRYLASRAIGGMNLGG